MKKRRPIGIFDLGRIPVTPVQREESVGTLKQYRERLAREEQESADRLQNAIAEKQAEGSRIMKECLEVSAPLKKTFWLQSLDQLKASLKDEEAFDELFLEKTTEDVDSNAVYDIVQAFLDNVPSLTGWSLDDQSRRRFNLYVACQVLNDVVITPESLLVMMNRCLSLGIFEGHSSFDEAFAPQVTPRVKPRVEPRRESLEDFESIDTTTRDGSIRAKNLAENLYVEEMLPIATAWVTSIQKQWGFSPTSEDMRRVSDWIERNNLNRLAPQTYDAARRWLVASGYWPESCLMETEKFNLSLESIDTSRLTVAQRNDLNRRELKAREADAARFGQ